MDEDYQAPVIIHFNNQSNNAFEYQWNTGGGNPGTSSDSHPVVILPSEGVYQITLTANNDKETKQITKQITVLPDKNLFSFSNLHLGINTAQSSIGSFFSSIYGKVIVAKDVSTIPGNAIDFAYFGLNADFTYNQFLSPDKVESTSFLPIVGATHTKIINSQELVGIQLSNNQFDNISNGSWFSAITISESALGLSPFDSSIIPRIVLFETSDGRKGAIKIKGCIVNGKESYIIVDIKVQKHK